MFTDGRSKKVIFLAHCLLNQNSISDGTADFPCANNNLIIELIKNEIGIVQMPCPELHCLGLDRKNIYGGETDVIIENTRIRKEMNNSEIKKNLNVLVENVILQIKEYNKNKFNILGIIGSNRSPSCGVETTSDNNLELKGEGVFIIELKKRLKDENIQIPIIGIKATEDYIKKIKNIL